MRTYDLGIAWNWEYDYDFVSVLEYACTEEHVSTYRIAPHNTEETLNQLRSGALAFRCFLDRASDDDETFEPVVRLVAKYGASFINQSENTERAKDKATMHLEFIANGLYAPYTIIISPFNKKKEIELSLSSLAQLGRPFIIKPANTTGGGTGVVLGAETLKQVIEARERHKNDKYLLQETVKPVALNGRDAWFRVLFAFGTAFPCWWNVTTHEYNPVTQEEEDHFHLKEIRTIMHKIHSICQLNFFSSEIALDCAGTFIVVDYVNEICDMRLQSSHADGVPDDIVHAVARLIARNIARKAVT
ncbi:MAG: hypothetical protein KGJ59_10160 [Bacteroidota bacterium]|nr:hypothetical protein [Bacteroidota bacterium]